MSILQALKSFFLGTGSPEVPSLLMDRHGKMINKELAAAFTTLLIDIALTDDMLQENEVTEIVSFLQQELALAPDAAEQILSFALDSRAESAKLARNLGPLALGLTEEQREHLLDLAVRVASADERISKAEEAVVANLAEILKVSPERVREKMGR
jgi:uncharacterized tellurite resistance protein B-like protein